MQHSLFNAQHRTKTSPLADRMRPTVLDDYLGQTHMVGEHAALRKNLVQGNVYSMIFWGPPGSGKTTLAQLMASIKGGQWIALSAILANMSDIRSAIAQASDAQQRGDAALLFVDEVHRFNKSQQDAFLPHIESGLITFIGTTTENPNFALNSALLSRVTVYRLKPLHKSVLDQLIEQAMASEIGLKNREHVLELNAKRMLIRAAGGDARRVLNILEMAAHATHKGTPITEEKMMSVLCDMPKLSGGRDAIYDQLSAFHKSVRGSNPDAALYWCGRMLESGAVPEQVFRRLTALASEDIGNADPHALPLVISAWQAYERLGMPEGRLALSQAVVYCAIAAKSNAIYLAQKAAINAVKQSQHYSVPVHLRNAGDCFLSTEKKTKPSESAYRYAHDEPNAYAAGECYFPEPMAEHIYYQPTEHGLEFRIKEKLAWLKKQDEKAKQRRYTSHITQSKA